MGNRHVDGAVDGRAAGHLGGCPLGEVCRRRHRELVRLAGIAQPAAGTRIGLEGKIVYDASKYINSSIHEVIRSLVEALLIVTVVIFLFLGSVRSVIIPVIAIPLSLIGTFFMMLVLGYSINLLTLLALVLAIGLVVDDAIIVVENIHRHIEARNVKPLQAAIQGARELANPIIAISVVLIAVYVPIGFMSGLTGALFTEFAFTLAGAVGNFCDYCFNIIAYDVFKIFKTVTQQSKSNTIN